MAAFFFPHGTALDPADRDVAAGPFLGVVKAHFVVVVVGMRGEGGGELGVFYEELGRDLVSFESNV